MICCLSFALRALVERSRAVGAGVGADRAAQMDDHLRRIADRLGERLGVFFAIDWVRHADVILRARRHVGLHMIAERRHHGLVAAHLLDHLAHAVNQRKDRMDAQQVARDRRGSADAAGNRKWWIGIGY